MSITILEVLQNAEINLNGRLETQLAIAYYQLHNAIVLLEKGYDVYADFNAIVEKYGSVDDAPDKE